eukprot:1142017-Pelagomonas_calceolata.AAC.1
MSKAWIKGKQRARQQLTKPARKPGTVTNGAARIHTHKHYARMHAHTHTLTHSQTDTHTFCAIFASTLGSSSRILDSTSTTLLILPPIKSEGLHTTQRAAGRKTRDIDATLSQICISKVLQEAHMLNLQNEVHSPQLAILLPLQALIPLSSSSDMEMFWGA